MSGEGLGELRRVYLALGEHCHEIAELGRKTSGIEASKLEEIRQKLAQARLVIWTELQRRVMEDWCNETETPEPFSKYPPKDMPHGRRG